MDRRLNGRTKRHRWHDSACIPRPTLRITTSALVHRSEPRPARSWRGGTGLPALLRGVRQTSSDFVTAVVTVADDGGSSGRLSQELGVVVPGHVRNCLVALAGRERLGGGFRDPL